MTPARPVRSILGLPEISRFFGIVVMMYYNEHDPPHFHAAYAGHRARVVIDDLPAEGDFPPRVLALLLAWAELHRVELIENWERARAGEQLYRIPPLE